MVAFGLITPVVLYRVRPDSWTFPDLVNGDSYFFIPRVLLAWLLIWELDSQPRVVAFAARGLCLLAVVLELPDHLKPAPQNYHWEQTSEAIRHGLPARIPILPEGWVIAYPGRPPRVRPASAAAKLGPAYPATTGVVVAQFSPEGNFPGGALPTARPIRTWCSRDESGRATGSLAFGPFPAPERLDFAVGGYPREPATICSSNSSPRANASMPARPIPANTGNCSSSPLPETWRGQPIVLIAADGATTQNGWLAISEPLQADTVSAPKK